MKSIKFALLGGAALAVTAAGAQAEDLNSLKSQIEALNARVAAMEAAPSVPAGYQLIAFSEADLQQTPGLALTARERATYSNKVNAITVLPTADAPAGASITWSGFVRAAVVFSNSDVELAGYEGTDPNLDLDDTEETNTDDLDILSRGEIAVSATTDTAVGEIGVKVKLRGNFDGAGNAAVSMPSAWGYWAMTPELTLGGGYAGSLGNIGYGMDGACTCHYINTTAFNPGDTTQMRLSYAAGPVSAAIALEDASVGGDAAAVMSHDQLGVAGEISYSGDTVSGEVSASWRGLNDSNDEVAVDDEDAVGDDSWQIGAGLAFGLGEMASVSLAAAMGAGPNASPVTYEGDDNESYDAIGEMGDWRNDWWGVSGIVTAHLSDEVHAELGAGYTSRDFDNGYSNDGNAAGDETVTASSEQWVVGGGLYYTPVDQLTIGVEASYTDTEADAFDDDDGGSEPYAATSDKTDTTVAMVSVWRF